MTDRETLELRQKRVELIAKIEEVRAKRKQYEQEELKRTIELERQSIELERFKKQGDRKGGIYDICSAISTHIVDNSRNIIGGEPVIMNIWTEDEINTLKQKAIEAADQPGRW